MGVAESVAMRRGRDGTVRKRNDGGAHRLGRRARF
jgi:hypothetical protein